MPRPKRFVCAFLSHYFSPWEWSDGRHGREPHLDRRQCRLDHQHRELESRNTAPHDIDAGCRRRRHLQHPNSVDLAIASQTILGLTMSSGIGLSTNGNDLTVNGAVELSDASTDLTVGGAELAALGRHDHHQQRCRNHADRAGRSRSSRRQEAGCWTSTTAASYPATALILFSDAVSAGTQLFNLDGTLTAHSTAADDLLSLAAATLTINVADTDGVIDLDGNDGVSTINVAATTRWCSTAACSIPATAARSICRPAPRSAETLPGR